MKTTTPDDDFDDISDELLDKSNEAASEFLDDTIFPLMYDFEHGDNEEYIPGVASFMLYTHLIEYLSENGWTANELKQAVDEFANQFFKNKTLH
jgi:hypothetical protein